MRCMCEICIHHYISTKLVISVIFEVSSVLRNFSTLPVSCPGNSGTVGSSVTLNNWLMIHISDLWIILRWNINILTINGYDTSYIVHTASLYNRLNIQWNLYKATTKFCGLSRQVVSHDRENKNDFVKTHAEIYVFLVRLPWACYTGSTVYWWVSARKTLTPVH